MVTTKDIFNEDWTFLKRKDHLKKLQDGSFDLIIIGGGMTGAAIIREAALRGLKTALIDKNDFAFGTSSRSSKLAHGGIRYLKNAEFGIVRESTTERNWLRHDFPNIVRPIAFNLCAYKGGKDTPLTIKVAVKLYHLLSNTFSKHKNYKKHKLMTPKEFAAEEPAVKKEGMIICGQYYDTNIDDSRITMETIKEAIVLGEGEVIALNYVKFDDYILDNGKITGIKVTDIITNSEFEINGTQVVNATGIWTDEQLRNYPNRVIRPTKGVHVVVPAERLGNKQGFGLRSIDDGRFFFVITRNEFSIIGTTDTDYQDNYNEPWCLKEDCDYLFNTVNHMFPNANLTYDDVIATWAGIRPLVMDPNAKNESDVSRQHLIIDTENGLTTISGGKLTIFRKMGEELLFHLIKKKKVFDNNRFAKGLLKKGYSKIPYLIGLGREEWDKWVTERKPDMPQDTLNLLYQQYGKGAFEIVENAMKNPKLAERFIEENQFIPAEIEYIMKYEFAPHLIDVLCRRTEVQIKVKHTKQKIIAEKVATIMAAKYGWNSETKDKEIKVYLEYVSKTIWF